MPPLQLAAPRDAARCEVASGANTVAALPAGSHADAWISAFLGMPAAWPTWTDACARSAKYDGLREAGDEVSFADAFPLLLISQARSIC